MSARSRSSVQHEPAPGSEPETVNEVRLVGRLSQDPELRTLPSGDPLWTFRVVIHRPGGPQASRSSVDALDCTVWSGRSRRTVATWRAGDLVEVSGAVRRRFFRAGGGAVSRVEIEVSSARVIRRRASA
jgi:single-strand DNA-binding protein